jgi:hypothetical protein
VKPGRKPVPFEERYTPEPNTGCWLWTGAVGSKGYGHLTVNMKTVAAHRYSLELATGQKSDRLVLHSCDTPICVNPRHLRYGTQLENIQEASRKGRLYKKGRPSMLSNTQAAEVQRLWAETPMKQSEIAEMFQVSTHAVWYAIHNRRSSK